MITFFAPCARCLAALPRSVNRPVDSITTSTPSSPHGSAAGSRSASTCSSRPSTSSALVAAGRTSPGYGPRIESYLSRCASVLRVGQVVDRDPLDLACQRRLPGLRSAEHVSADPAESVDAHAYCHSLPPEAKMNDAGSLERWLPRPACPGQAISAPRRSTARSGSAPAGERSMSRWATATSRSSWSR